MKEITIKKQYLTLHEESFKYVTDNPIRTTDDVVKLVQSLGYHQRDREVLLALMLNSKGNVISLTEVSIGDISSANACPREVFKLAILTSSSAVIVVHNHPSGDVTPSHCDLEATAKLAAAGDLLGIRFLDHIIVGPDGHYTSLKEHNLI